MSDVHVFGFSGLDVESFPFVRMYRNYDVHIFEFSRFPAGRFSDVQFKNIRMFEFVVVPELYVFSSF